MYTVEVDAFKYVTLHHQMMHKLQPLTHVASKCHFCLRFAHYRVSLGGFKDNHISLAKSEIPRTCNDASAMVYLRLFACDDK